MVFVRDEGGVFDAPLEGVWEFFRSGQEHSDAHRHREVRRETLADNSGRYSWVQEFMGKPEPFAMQWTSFAPIGLAYQVTVGPFAGSKFFLYYTPLGRRTGVTIVGEFTSPTIPPSQVEAAVAQFFSTEFEQDRAAIRERTGRRDGLRQG